MAVVSDATSWSYEMESELIDEVRKLNHLWNIKNPLYSKKTYKKLSYEQIANIFRERWPACSAMFSGDTLMKKFSILKSYYLKETRKWKILKSGSEGLGFQPKWTHFNHMLFLDDMLVPEESISSLNISLSSTSDAEMNTDIEAVCLMIEEGTPKTTSSALHVKRPCKRKRGAENSVEEAMASANEFLKKLANNNDSEDSYGDFIASEMRQIKDPMKRDLAHIEIQNVLIKYKYDLN